MNISRLSIRIGIALITTLFLTGSTGLVVADTGDEADLNCDSDEKHISVEGVHHHNANSDDGTGNKEMCVGGGDGKPEVEGESDDAQGSHGDISPEGKTDNNPN